MSDDEYFNDDDLFTAEELNNIPLLNQPPSPIIHSLDITNESGVTSRPSQPRVSNAPGTSTNNLNSVALDRPAAPQNSLSPGNQGRNQVSAPVTPARASGSGGPAPIAVQRSASRLSTIMNALRTSQIGQNPGQRVGISGQVFGPPTGLLQTPKRNPYAFDSRKQSSPSMVAGPSRQSSQKRIHSAPSANGLKRRRSSSPSPGHASEGASRRIRAETWGTMEEELICPICCDVYVAPQITSCGHSACAPCLKSWLSRNTSCPICRTYLSAHIKPSNNLLAASMIDRLFSEASKHQLPDWCPGGAKRVDWGKRKQSWDREVAKAAEAARASRIATRAVSAAMQRQYQVQPLFLPPEDDEHDYEGYYGY
ncbi:hypothetical protein CTheo_3501 [Ceratobasidium theobromae]|uniref:RING-type domain-containing protein n=1 Tax=Ceratobasidium theobromae TaxID=1582974 RepID=A0A5N5QPF6_9AGAM|nr:hypothetical protein CTheo_3501 [Ceratobasidium theobromae]